MKKPYIIEKYNSEEEIRALELKAKTKNPLEFLEFIRIGDEWASDAPAFDISKKVEFVLIDESLIDRIKTALTNFGYNVKITDVTKNLLYNNLNLSNASEDVKKSIDRYYVETFDVNDVLDKMSDLELTDKMLTESDKLILKKNP